LVQKENQFSFCSHMPAYLKENMLSALFSDTSGLNMTLSQYGFDNVFNHPIMDAPSHKSCTI